MKGRCRRCGSSVHLRTTYYYYEYEYVLKIPLKVHMYTVHGGACNRNEKQYKQTFLYATTSWCSCSGFDSRWWCVFFGFFLEFFIPSELLTHILCHLDVIFFLLTIFFAWKQVQFLFGLLHLCWSLFGGSLPAHVICSRFGQCAAGRCPTFALHLGL